MATLNGTTQHNTWKVHGACGFAHVMKFEFIKTKMFQHHAICDVQQNKHVLKRTEKLNLSASKRKCSDILPSSNFISEASREQFKECLQRQQKQKHATPSSASYWQQLLHYIKAALAGRFLATATTCGCHAQPTVALPNVNVEIEAALSACEQRRRRQQAK